MTPSELNGVEGNVIPQRGSRNSCCRNKNHLPFLPQLLPGGFLKVRKNPPLADDSWEGELWNYKMSLYVAYLHLQLNSL